MTSSIYLKKNKDYNNVFLEDGKILKVGRSPEVPWSLPHLPPLTAFFSWGRNILFQISGGAYAHCAPRLRTPLGYMVNQYTKGVKGEQKCINKMCKNLKTCNTLLEYQPPFYLYV